MPPEGSRHRKRPRLFDVVIIPVGEGEKTTTLRASLLRLVLYGLAAFLIFCGIAFAVLVYTPVASFVPIPNPGLERRYGQQIASLQQQLGGLVQDVMLLKDYNTQLRKALGEGSSGDSTTVRGAGPSLLADVPPSSQEGQLQVRQTSAPPATGEESAPLDEGNGAVDLGTIGGYSSVVTAPGDGGWAAFPLLSPVEGIPSQGFDPARSHYGIDIAGKRGTPVFAAADGHVVFSGWTYDDGNMLIIAHDGGYMTVYKHNQMLLTSVQAVVRRGEAIALLGESGRTSAGPHLHFEVWRDGVPRDPNDYLLTPAKPQ